MYNREYQIRTKNYNTYYNFHVDLPVVKESKLRLPIISQREGTFIAKIRWGVQ